MSEQKPFNIGYPTDKGCDLCGCTPAQIESRFNYITCEKHSHISPVEWGKHMDAKGVKVSIKLTKTA